MLRWRSNTDKYQQMPQRTDSFDPTAHDADTNKKNIYAPWSAEEMPASARHDTKAATWSNSTANSAGRHDRMVADTAAMSSGSGPVAVVCVAVVEGMAAGRWSRAMTDSSDSCVVDGGDVRGVA